MEPYLCDHNLPTAIICDIDGTIALHGPDYNDRGHFEYERAIDDHPNPDIISLIELLKASEHVEIIFMSGREDRCRDDTVRWICSHVFGFGLPLASCTFQLLMRTTGDHRKDDVIKGELFDAHIRGKYDVICAIDDRDQVVKMWREAGITCLQVAYGDF